MPTKYVPNDEAGEFVQSLIDGPDEFGTHIAVLPNYNTGKSKVTWTWLPKEDSEE